MSAVLTSDPILWSSICCPRLVPKLGFPHSWNMHEKEWVCVVICNASGQVLDLDFEEGLKNGPATPVCPLSYASHYIGGETSATNCGLCAEVAQDTCICRGVRANDCPRSLGGLSDLHINTSTFFPKVQTDAVSGNELHVGKVSVQRYGPAIPSSAFISHKVGRLRGSAASWIMVSAAAPV